MHVNVVDEWRIDADDVNGLATEDVRILFCAVGEHVNYYTRAY